MIWKVITEVVTSIIIGDTDNAVQQVPYVSTIGMMHCLITDVFLFFPAENYWRIQTKGRGTLWKAEPKMDQVDAQVVLSVLFWEKLSCAKSRILIRGGSKPSGPKTAAKYSTQYKSKESAAKYSTQFKSKETAVRYILSNSILSNDP